MSPGLIMAILVFEGGIVHSRLIESKEFNVTSDDLVKFSNFLNEKFKGHTLFQVKLNIKKEMEEMKKKFDLLYYNALRLAEHTCNTEDDREIFVKGTLKVIDHIEAKDLERMKNLLEFLEKRSELLKLLDKIEESEGIFISFGEEVFGSQLEEWSIISSPYRVRGEFLGFIGTIGPIYMDYSKLIPMVDYMAKMFSEILEIRF